MSKWWEEREADAQWEYEHIQEQVRRRNDPYGVLEGLDVFLLPSPPPPLIEGQVLFWKRFSHLFGRQVKPTMFLKVVLWNGKLGWAEFNPGPWL